LGPRLAILPYGSTNRESQDEVLSLFLSVTPYKADEPRLPGVDLS